MSLEFAPSGIIERGLKVPLVSDAVSRAGPHVAHVEIAVAIAIGISPGGGHAGRDVFNPCLACDVGEVTIPFGIAVIAIEIVSSVIVGDIEIGVAVVVVVLPGRGKGIAAVVLVQTKVSRGIGEAPVAIITEENVAASIVGIVVGNGASELGGIVF